MSSRELEQVVEKKYVVEWGWKREDCSGEGTAY